MITLITIGFQEIGGATGLAAGAAWALQQLLGWLDKRRTAEITEDQQQVSATSSAVADAATVNAVMLRNLEAVQREVERVHGVNADLLDQLAQKDAKILAAQHEIERLMNELATLYQRLEGMKSS